MNSVIKKTIITFVVFGISACASYADTFVCRATDNYDVGAQATAVSIEGTREGADDGMTRPPGLLCKDAVFSSPILVVASADQASSSTRSGEVTASAREEEMRSIWTDRLGTVLAGLLGTDRVSRSVLPGSEAAVPSTDNWSPDEGDPRFSEPDDYQMSAAVLKRGTDRI
ncbi:hypothetical protein [Rhizobium sp. Root483D2]|uniref:hypothetical protein n=1 Tax=Rhizobium sp. Root483D2 TaxID=1736545 RepID=UPI000713BBFA|nr:hypothetical protein [Rhizobium sp. Root483D2]KQY25953.1 hypothetical protein ASD32_26090 [Rhizobium sp. Root483D2]